MNNLVHSEWLSLEQSWAIESEHIKRNAVRKIALPESEKRRYEKQ